MGSKNIFILRSMMVCCSICMLVNVGSGKNVAYADHSTVSSNMIYITEQEDNSEMVSTGKNKKESENLNEKSSEEWQDKITEDIEKNTIYSVSFPTNTKAVLDPGNVSGRGQIFSERYVVENYGNTDVMVRIKNITVYYKSEESIYEFSEDVITNHNSGVKKLNINMVWENKGIGNQRVLHISEGERDEDVLFLQSAQYDENENFVAITDESKGLFYFTGTVNANPDLVWEDGEITVTFDYEVMAAEGNDNRRSVSSGNLS